MSLLEEIQIKIDRNEYEFSIHALNQSLSRRIHVFELCEAVENGELIENYPNDKYGPSCLLLGFTKIGRALHIQCSYPVRPLVKIITLYVPNPALWDNLRVRKVANE